MTPSDDEPVFTAPWEAQVFALVTLLHARGVFTWPEWSAALTDTLQGAADGVTGNPDRGMVDTTWDHWLSTLEQLLVKQGVAAPAELRMLQAAWDDAARRTPHGEPIVLESVVVE